MMRHLRFLAAALAVSACASGGGPPAPPGSLDPPTATNTAPQPLLEWPVRSREHVDLWLHGLAMLMDDTARVPLFRRGYREELRSARARANVTTRLDAERDRLRERFPLNPRLALDAQFLPFAFESWDQLRRAIEIFQQAQGNPQRAGDQATAQAIAVIAQVFPTAADREWLRVFAGALDDESTRFYNGYWTAAQRDRTAVIAAVEQTWRATQPKLRRFLTNTQQRAGTLLLSLPLGGEGRTSGNVVAVGFPATTAAAPEAVYVAVHEFVGATAGSVVSDNVTPAEQRSGVADRYVSAAQVRGGYLLLQKTAPELAPGYARYYLALASGRTTGDLAAALAESFPLPAGIADGLVKQLDLVLGGI